ncbi:MAG: hypothetical protein OHK0022_60820 [Roseiflexaceae bacterium]
MVITAESGALTVAITATMPLVVIGTLEEEEFFETETDDLAAALVALDRAFRERVDVPGLRL